MARPTVNVLFNLTTNDVVCTNPAGDANFIKLDVGDYITWRDAAQMGGDLLTGAVYPPVIPGSGEQESAKMFLQDYSTGLYQQVILAGTSEGSGGGDHRYVCCAWFGGPTVGVPYLEAYDNYLHDTWACKPLGNGTPSNSAYRAIATTNGAPGSETWAGTPLAGLDSRVALDVIPIASSKYLYWNMKQVLQDWMASWPSADWYNTSIVFAIHYTYA